MSVDEELLAAQKESSGSESDSGDSNSNEQESSDRASQLALAKKAASEKETNAGQDPKSLREAVQMEKAKKLAEEKKQEDEGEKPNPISIQTASLLRSAWMNLLASLGTSLLWIDVHVLGSSVLGKMFCKPGEEWAMQAGGTSAKEVKKKSKMLKLIEPMGIACCNLGCLLVIIAILVVISLIASIFSPDILKVLWELVSAMFTMLVKLIKG